MSDATIHDWLIRFRLDGFLHAHVAAVVLKLPEHVRADLMTDAGFRLCDYEPDQGTFLVPMAIPGRHGASRSVVLKRTLRRRPEPFVRYVIAHELAHAHLRNVGRHPDEDPELAADALAAEWGFPRP